MSRRALSITVAVVAPLVVMVALIAVARERSSSPKKLSIASATAGADAAAGSTTATPALAPVRSITYQAGPGLPPLTGRAAVYEVQATVTADTARRIADAFGVSGQPVATADGFTVK